MLSGYISDFLAIIPFYVCDCFFVGSPYSASSPYPLVTFYTVQLLSPLLLFFTIPTPLVDPSSIILTTTTSLIDSNLMTAIFFSPVSHSDPTAYFPLG